MRDLSPKQGIFTRIAAVYAMVPETQIHIRVMLPSEKSEIEKLFGRSLGLIDKIFFQLTLEGALKRAKKQLGSSLVGRLNDRIVGSVSMRIQLIGGRRAGFIAALVSDREFRGRGVGKSLVDGAISWLEERECEVIYATADRYNSPSWNTFIHRGFSIYEFPQQLRNYRLNFLRLWLVEFHFIGYGTFFLRWDREEEIPRGRSEAWHFIAAWLGLSLMLGMRALRMGETVSLLPLLIVVAWISLIAHELPQKMIGRLLGLETDFKVWEPGLFLGSLFGAVGSIFPVYGSTYVKQLDWRYDPRKSGMGAFFAIGPFVSFVMASVFWVLSSTTRGFLATSGRIGFLTNLMNVFFNLIPLQSAGGLVWDGKKILTWSKAVWMILFTGTTSLIIIDILF